MIKLQSLHKFFNKGRQNEIHVINDISLELPDRGMVAIFGKSGCGKTTLLNVIGGLDRVESGKLTVEGKDVRHNTDVIRNQYMGYIFQNYNLHKTESCFDNVADALRLCGMTDPNEIEARVMAALTNVGMEKYAKRTPDTLSGGQQQRIAIARAIVKNPRIILADEPTGNLDEANTVMIMDLLKAIAKDHLVLLVTHEVNLVDHYCDTVIELSDGKVVSVKTNDATGGYAVKDKNHIYLGELEKTEISDAKTEIEFYGDVPEEPIQLKIVNHGGKLYVQFHTPKIQILDEFSEIKLKEGVYEQKTIEETINESIDMSELPSIEGKRFGRLFSFGSSVKSGYTANFKNGKKGKKILRGCMCLFAAVVVFMSAVFGTAFADIITARESYNHNVFYVYTPNGTVSQKINEAVGKADTGVDWVRLHYNYIPQGDNEVLFLMGSFETFLMDTYSEAFKTNAVYMDASVASEMPLVIGKKDNLQQNEMLITTAVADALLETSSLGHISEYRDLIGLISPQIPIDGTNPHIVGIVRSEESAIYLNELAMAKFVSQGNASQIYLANTMGQEVAEGEAILVVKYFDKDKQSEFPKQGETVKLHGKDIKIANVMRYYPDYYSWLEEKNIKKSDEYTYFRQLAKAEYPNLDEKEYEFDWKVEELREKRMYEYYDYYYSDMDQFLRDSYFMNPDSIDYWLALEKGVKEAKFLYMPQDYYKAICYKEQNGSYPTVMELQEIYENLPDQYKEYDRYVQLYQDEFYSMNRNGFRADCGYLVSEKDYISFSKQIGQTDAIGNFVDDKYIEYEIVGKGEVAVVDKENSSTRAYTVIHSTDPSLTAQWIEREFSDLDAPSNWTAVLTPDDIFDRLISEKLETIVAGLIAMAVILVLMSVCMYFIMRSSLMNRIKEVGIYRAIGVSKKNLVFKFLIEAIVLTTLTVFVGYLLTSAFLVACLSASAMVESIFFYPVWLAGALLVLLYALSLICGTLPILSLLRKTPSEILAKYDI